MRLLSFQDPIASICRDFFLAWTIPVRAASSNNLRQLICHHAGANRHPAYPLQPLDSGVSRND